jgi:hypothetical protein
MSYEPALTWILIGATPFTHIGIPYDAEIASLFTEAEIEDDYPGFHKYLVRLEDFRDRLQLRGFTSQRAREALNSAIQEYNSKIIPEFSFLDDPHLKYDKMIRRLSKAINVVRGVDRPLYSYPDELLNSLNIDILMALRLTLDLVENASIQIRR